MARRWFACPLCERSAKTRAGLLEQGCEGKHEELMPVSEIDPLVEAAQTVVYAPTGAILGDCIEDLGDALKSFKDPQ